jgi:hypothetical protein
MTEPDRPAGPPPTTGSSYEVRVRTHVAPAFASSLAIPVHRAVVPRNTVRRLAVVRDGDDGVDLPALLKRLTECDVTVLDVRLCRPPRPGTSREP